MTIPPSYSTATIVVPCGTSGRLPGGSPRPPGSRCAACVPRNSVNEEDPGVRKAVGSPPARQRRSLAALLHEALDELLGVALEDVVDLVEDRVDVVVLDLRRRRRR